MPKIIKIDVLSRMKDVWWRGECHHRLTIEKPDGTQTIKYSGWMPKIIAYNARNQYRFDIDGVMYNFDTRETPCDRVTYYIGTNWDNAITDPSIPQG